MFQGPLGLGVLKVVLMFLRYLLCTADVPFPELLARGVQPRGDFLGVMLGLRVM